MIEIILKDFAEWIKTQPVYIGGAVGVKEVLVLREGEMKSAVEVYHEENKPTIISEVVEEPTIILNDFAEWIKTQPVYIGGKAGEKEVLVLRDDEMKSAVEVYHEENKPTIISEVVEEPTINDYDAADNYYDDYDSSADGWDLGDGDLEP